jgi:hypothetical protein
MSDNVIRINERGSDDPRPEDAEYFAALHRFLDLLSEQERTDWRHMEYWTYLNDGECRSNEWEEGPRYLGLRLLDWVEMSDKSPRLIDICGMRHAISRWRSNHPDSEQLRRRLAELCKPA